jgi:[acyl-carrier-protein] S-malonyltransferase
MIDYNVDLHNCTSATLIWLHWRLSMSKALLFPGQGSQSVGMLAALAAQHSTIEATFKEASEVLGWDVWQLAQQGPEAELNRTERTQPVLLAAGIAMYRTWVASNGAKPTLMAGHSLGEYTALVAAGSLDFADALRLVEIRGQLMQQAVPPGVGGMAAILGMEDAAVEAFCAAYTGEGVLEPVNFNAPGQVVVAGTVGALEWLAANGRERGAKKVLRLAMSVPSHCSLMREAAAKLGEHLARINVVAPNTPVLHNLDAAPRQDADSIRLALTEQLHKPVRWVQTIRSMSAQGVTAFVECGPGKVLTTLGKRIVTEPNVSHLATDDPAILMLALETTQN